MNIRQVLGSNLSNLMRAFPELDSQRLLYKKSGVATSTIGRIRRSDVAATVDNVESLASAFKLTAADLLDPLLLRRLNFKVEIDARQRAFEIAERVRTARLTDQQLTILSTTLDALQSAG